GNRPGCFQGHFSDGHFLDPQHQRATCRLFVTGRKTMSTAIIKPQRGPLTIALMVLGFVVWFPLGRAMPAYILWGEMFGGSQEKAEAFVNKSRAWCRDQEFRHNRHKGGWRNSSGNAA